VDTAECEYVRGVFFGQRVILEQAVFEDPRIRAACARENLAILFLVPAQIGQTLGHAQDKQYGGVDPQAYPGIPLRHFMKGSAGYRGTLGHDLHLYAPPPAGIANILSELEQLSSHWHREFLRSLYHDLASVIIYAKSHDLHYTNL
jgi:hypothetical protein